MASLRKYASGLQPGAGTHVCMFILNLVQCSANEGLEREMVDELEALVGYVFVVGGRAVNTTPPGALVELPPRRPQRGREQDTFFALVTPTGSNQAQAAFYEQLAKLAAELYFRSGGGVTSGLREAISAVNSHLLEHNQLAGARYEVNMICLVMRGREIYAARTGSCFGMLRQGEQFVSFPGDLKDEYALNVLPLGYSPAPDIKLAHYDIAPGHVMVIADSGLAGVEQTKLLETLGAGGVQEVVDLLKPLSGRDCQAMVIEIVSNMTPDPLPATTGSHILRSSSAPAATPADPVVAAPVQSAPVKSTPVQPAPVKSTPVKPAQAPANPIASRPSLPVAPISRPSRAAPPPEEVPTPTPRLPVPPSKVEVAEPDEDDVEAESAGQGMPPGEEIAEVPDVDDADTSGLVEPGLGRKILAVFAGALSFMIRVLGSIMDRFLPEPQKGGPQVPAMLAAAIAILVPVVVVFIVVALQLSRVDLTQFEQMVSEVQQQAKQARAVPLTEEGQAKTAWLGILQRIDQVEKASGHTDDPDLQQIRDEAQGILDKFDKVTRRRVVSLRTFNEGAKLVSVIVQGGVDVYTLDAATSSVYRDTLNPNGVSLAVRSTQAVIQRGQAVSSFSVNSLVDALWMPEGGVRNVLAAIDAQGILVTYSPTFAPATAQRPAGTDLWNRPVAVGRWQDRMYILDAGANQIWRYLPSGKSYSILPEPYFADGEKPNLKDAVDFGIDSSGNLYILFSNGIIKKYTVGTEEPFTLSGVPGGALKSANNMYIDNDSLLPAIYVVDPLDQAIYEFTLGGTFKHRYKSSDPNAFRQLTAVTAFRDNLYVASGNALYTFSITDITGTPTP